MADRTPGPWEVEENSIMADFEGQRVQIALMSQTRWTYPDGGKTRRLQAQCEGNGQLMAAAPELLQAVEGPLYYGSSPDLLERMAEAFHEQGRLGWSRWLCHKAELERAALAKVKGE